MFKEETVFILGAGASAHYGYPTGEELIQKVKEAAEALSHCYAQSGHIIPGTPAYFNHLKQIHNLHCSQTVDFFKKECSNIKGQLRQVNPLVIDYFLDKNGEIRDIGKLLIGYVILQSEHTHKQLGTPSKLKEDWHRFIVEKLTRDCDSENLINNKVNFITFNYDVSLERRLYSSLNNFKCFKIEDKKSFLNDHLILHIYGQVRSPAFEDVKYGFFPIKAGERPDSTTIVTCLDQAWEAAQCIRTISEEKYDSPIIKIAKEKIDTAKNVFILGYGFDENNSGILALPETLSISNERPKKIQFTNSEDHNRINKRAGSLFFNGRLDPFLDHCIPSDEDLLKGTPSIQYFKKREKGWHHEKSTRRVYDALALDFDLI